MGIDLGLYPDIGIGQFGFSSIDEPVSVPSDLEKLRELAYYLFEILQALL